MNIAVDYVFHFDVPLRALPSLMRGALYTLQMSCIASFLGLLIGIFGAMGRMSGNRIAYGLSTAYVEVIRNTPVLVQLYFLYFGLPSLGLNLGSKATAILGLTISAGGYLTEIVRAGIQSIQKNQIEAAFSLGMTSMQVFFLVRLPQAVRKILLPVGNQFIATTLASAIAAMIAAEELTYMAMLLESRTFRSLEIYIVTIAIYFIICQVLRVALRLLGRVYLRKDPDFIRSLPPNL